ncbi:unnamed protein product [Arctogadus glacialis]
MEPVRTGLPGGSKGADRARRPGWTPPNMELRGPVGLWFRTGLKQQQPAGSILTTAPLKRAPKPAPKPAPLSGVTHYVSLKLGSSEDHRWCTVTLPRIRRSGLLISVCVCDSSSDLIFYYENDGCAEMTWGSYRTWFYQLRDDLHGAHIGPGSTSSEMTWGSYRTWFYQL